MANRDQQSPPSRAGPSPIAPGVSPGTPEARTPGSRRGRMLAESAAVEEWLGWVGGNGEAAGTWMCTPRPLEEGAAGGVPREGDIEARGGLIKLRPRAPHPGFWAGGETARAARVKGERR